MLRIAAAVLIWLVAVGGVSGNSLIDSMVRQELYDQEAQEDFGLYEGIPATPQARKSLPKAVFLSAVLPGTGHYYLGAKKQAKAFWAVEATMWAGYLGLNWYGNRAKEDYRVYAAVHAGTNQGIDAEDYYHAIEVYRTNEVYNEELRREARDLYPNDPQAQRQYVLENGYWGDEGWSWEDDGAWDEYLHLRTVSRDYLHKATYCVGATLLNRIVSAIFAAKLTKDYNTRVEEGHPGLNLRFEPDPEKPGIRVVLTYTY